MITVETMSHFDPLFVGNRAVGFADRHPCTTVTTFTDETPERILEYIYEATRIHGVMSAQYYRDDNRVELVVHPESDLNAVRAALGTVRGIKCSIALHEEK